MPSMIFNLSSLEILDLQSNKLSGRLMKKFDNLPNLLAMSVKDNQFHGELPSTLYNCKQLQILSLSVNNFSGRLPPQIGNLTMLHTLFLAYNNFEGLISKSLGNLRLLQVLNLPFNNLTVESLELSNIFFKSQVVEELSPLATWKRISHLELQQATDGFNPDNLIGKECLVLRNIRHRNLVKIISACSSMNFKAFILEYMPNGNLETWLYNRCLNILQRLNIMTDVAAALEYLHLGLSTPIIHCDLKPSNVLLDAEMVAHVADLGIANLLNDGNSLTRTMTLASMGYMTPEYGSEGIISTRGDAYSYDILLMEIFTRKKPTDDMFYGEISLKSWVEESLPLSINEVVDTDLLRNEMDYAAIEGCLSSVMRLALNCCEDSPGERMDMKTVSVTLNKIKSKFLQDIE
ncbi:hypothetical protein I3760_05G220300 [Carya illinoinensis]|nr:hypothetical protein I3760_05G220300 [Carya illinoinensis]